MIRRQRSDSWFWAGLTMLFVLSPLGRLPGNDRADANDLSRSYVTVRMQEGKEVGNASTELRPLGEDAPPATEAPSPTPPSDATGAALSADLATMAGIAPWIAQHAPGSAEARYDSSMRIAWAVARWSRNNGIRPELVTALIYHESRFSPTAKSPTGDHGLMQLHGRPIYDVDANVRAGCAHLAGNLKAAQGDEFRALCFYNGGPRGPGYGQCQRYARRVLGTADGIED